MLLSYPSVSSLSYNLEVLVLKNQGDFEPLSWNTYVLKWWTNDMHFLRWSGCYFKLENGTDFKLKQNPKTTGSNTIFSRF